MRTTKPRQPLAPRVRLETARVFAPSAGRKIQQKIRNQRDSNEGPSASALQPFTTGPHVSL
jgi:hypothetical protein